MIMAVWEIYEDLLVLYGEKKSLEAAITEEMKKDTNPSTGWERKRLAALDVLYREKFVRAWQAIGQKTPGYF
jgi:hypothetical protein